MVPYWVGQSPSQGMFPKKTPFKSCNEYEMDWGKTSRHGVLTYKGSYCLIYGCLCRGCVSLHP
jgi:hypothetical protein